GRFLSALFDSGTILLTGWLALLLVRQSPNLLPGAYHTWSRAWSVALLTATLVAFIPLQLQLSHFYAVDTILLFFVMLTLVACVALVQTEKPVRWLLLTGLAYGLAMATKFSAAPLALPVLVALLLRGYRQRDYLSALVFLFFIGAITVLVFMVMQPYALLDLPSFIQQVSEQGNMARGLLDYPYVRQFAGTIPYLYQAQNMLLWGLGLTLGLAAAVGLIWLIWAIWRRWAAIWLVPLSWVLVYSAITGAFYVKYMRYMLLIYPVLALFAATVLIVLATREWPQANMRWQPLLQRALPVIRAVAIVLVLAGTMFQGLALLNVYGQPNTRIQASRWMYAHLKPGSRLTYEQWDDPLPVDVDGHSAGMFAQATYTDASGNAATGMDLYGDDTTAKMRSLAELLSTVDVITMASDRLDKSIPRLPSRYPLTIHYYQLLFSGQLGFHLKARFDNRPNLFGITLDDSSADESYSVFDHPTVRIFVRTENYTPDQLLQKLLNTR
ncbi:MAG: glycosyltransferase family 39 protein, partial [Ktedonobacteraceae bacterium]|nr:glycosyltransferase family 39 protein [Ktedonobacteraceae bacterium]